MDRKYLKIQEDEDYNQESFAIEMESSHGSRPHNLPTSAPGFIIKILFKEKSYEILSLCSTSTVSELKAAVEAKTNVAVSSQRLIFAGKALRPDDKTLESFKVISNSSIHLFPTPIVATTVNPLTAANSDSTSAASGLAPAALNNPVVPNNNNIRNAGAIHFDPSISQFSRDVKWWSLVLLFLSALTLFNNFTYFSSTGTGNNYHYR